MRTVCAVTLVLLGLAIAVCPAYGDTALVVLGPIGKGDVAAVKGALGKLDGATLSPKAIDANCAADAACLTTAGSELGARLVLAVVLRGGKISLTLADTGAKLLLGSRDLDIAAKKLAKELPPAVTKFIDETIVGKAKALFEEGNAHYKLGEFTQALDKYKLAYRVKPLPAFQFNIAQCHRKLGQHKEAIAMYQAYLVDMTDAEKKTMVDSLIAEEKKALSDQTASEDSRERERLATERKKAEEARKIREAEAAAQAETAKTEQARIEAERARDKDYNRHPARKFMLVTGALGLATAGVGGYFAYRVRNRQTTYDDNCIPGLLPPDEVDACVADIDQGRKDARLANILIGAGGGVVLASLIVFILDPGNVERPKERASVAVSPSSIQVVIRW